MSNQEKKKIDYYWGVIRKAVRGSDREKILKKIKENELEISENNQDESFIINLNHQNDDQIEEENTVTWTDWKTWRILIKSN